MASEILKQSVPSSASFSCVHGLMNWKPKIHRYPPAFVRTQCLGQQIHRLLLAIDTTGQLILWKDWHPISDSSKSRIPIEQAESCACMLTMFGVRQRRSSTTTPNSSTSSTSAQAEAERPGESASTSLRPSVQNVRRAAVPDDSRLRLGDQRDEHRRQPAHDAAGGRRDRGRARPVSDDASASDGPGAADAADTAGAACAGRAPPVPAPIQQQVASFLSSEAGALLMAEMNQRHNAEVQQAVTQATNALQRRQAAQAMAGVHGGRTAARAVTARAEPDADGSEEHDVVAPGLAWSPAGAGPGTGGGSPEPCEPRGLQQPIRGYGTGAPKTFLDNVTPVRNAVMGRDLGLASENDGRASSNLPPRCVSLPRPRGVTVSCNPRPRGPTRPSCRPSRGLSSGPKGRSSLMRTNEQQALCSRRAAPPPAAGAVGRRSCYPPDRTKGHVSARVDRSPVGWQDGGLQTTKCRHQHVSQKHRHQKSWHHCRSPGRWPRRV